MSKTLHDFVLDYDHAMMEASKLAAATAPASGGGSVSYRTVIPTHTITTPSGNMSYTIGYMTEEEDEDENTLSKSADLPAGQMLGRCAVTDKTFALTLKPDSGMSVAECMKISMLITAYDTAGPEEFSPYEYVKANNLERHFQIRDADQEV